MAGDYNVVPTPADIYPTHSYDKDALLQPQSRAAFQRLLKQGWTDAIRALHPEELIYTYWDYMRNRWPRDAGLRLDHVLLSPDLRERLVASGVDREVRGMANASDHAPVWVKLGNGPARRKKTSSAIRSASASPRRSKQTAVEVVRPLLVIDGDSFAHRAYHASPRNGPAVGVLRDDLQ